MRILIGSSGLIGKNLQTFLDFDYLYNSKNIDQFDSSPSGCDLYLSCLPATKWIVNKSPFDDLKNTMDIFYRIKDKSYNNVYLFSTIDVYNKSPLLSDESFIPIFDSLNYGSNRYIFETLVYYGLKYQSIKIIRLPGLFGKGLKKNILFDIKNNNNINQINTNSTYQWYNLDRLSNDITLINDIDMEIINIFPEPINTLDIVQSILKERFIGYHGYPVEYNYKTLSSPTGYWYDKEMSFNEIKDFLCK